MSNDDPFHTWHLIQRIVAQHEHPVSSEHVQIQYIWNHMVALVLLRLVTTVNWFHFLPTDLLILHRPWERSVANNKTVSFGLVNLQWRRLLCSSFERANFAIPQAEDNSHGIWLDPLLKLSLGHYTVAAGFVLTTWSHLSESEWCFPVLLHGVALSLYGCCPLFKGGSSSSSGEFK